MSAFWLNDKQWVRLSPCCRTSREACLGSMGRPLAFHLTPGQGADCVRYDLAHPDLQAHRVEPNRCLG